MEGADRNPLLQLHDSYITPQGAAVTFTERRAAATAPDPRTRPDPAMVAAASGVSCTVALEALPEGVREGVESSWLAAGWPLGDTQILIAPLPEDNEEEDVVISSGSDGRGPSAASAFLAVEPLVMGRVGEVWVAGSCVSAGYYTPPEQEGAENADVSCDDAAAATVGSAIRRDLAAVPAPCLPAKAAVAAGTVAGRFLRVRLTAAQAELVATAADVIPLLDATYFRTGDLGRLVSSSGTGW